MDLKKVIEKIETEKKSIEELLPRIKKAPTATIARYTAKLEVYDEVLRYLK